MNECNASLEPSGPIGAPLCVDLHIPVCTYRQYGLELQVINRSNAQFNGNPLAMEEHLASDQGCKLGASTMHHPPVPWQTSPLAVDFLWLGLLAMLLVYVLQSKDTNRKGTSHDSSEADR